MRCAKISCNISISHCLLTSSCASVSFDHEQSFLVASCNKVKLAHCCSSWQEDVMGSWWGSHPLNTPTLGYSWQEEAMGSWWGSHPLNIPTVGDSLAGRGHGKLMGLTSFKHPYSGVQLAGRGHGKLMRLTSFKHPHQPTHSYCCSSLYEETMDETHILMHLLSFKLIKHSRNGRVTLIGYITVMAKGLYICHCKRAFIYIVV